MNVCMRQKTCKLEQMRTLSSGSLPSVHLVWVLWAISPKPWAVSVGSLHTDGNRVHINCTQDSLSISAKGVKIVVWRHKSDDQHCDFCQIHADSCSWKIIATWSSTEPCLSPETKQRPQPSWLQKIPKDQTDQPCDSLHPRCTCYHMKRESQNDLLHQRENFAKANCILLTFSSLLLLSRQCKETDKNSCQRLDHDRIATKESATRLTPTRARAALTCELWQDWYSVTFKSCGSIDM